MNRIILLIINIFCTSLLSISFAQVTIGSDYKPLDGSVLELKEFIPTVAGGANSYKGLLLPRTKLTKMNSLDGIEGVDPSEYISHAGLMVYNVHNDNCEAIYPGVYIWSGTSWNQLTKSGNVSVALEKLEDERPGDLKQTYTTGHFQILDPATSAVIEDAGVWMLENLKAKVYDSGVVDKQQLVFHTASTQPAAETAYFTYPGKDASRFESEGYYYSGVAALNNQFVDGLYNTASGKPLPKRVQQGICPNGWRIPTYEDWQLLVKVIEQSECEYTFPKPNNGKWWGGLIHSDPSNTDFTSRKASDGGFDAYASGSYTNDGNFNAKMNKYPSFITTYPVPVTLTAGGTKYPMYGLFSFDESEASSQFHTSPTVNMPVRCVKGNTPPVQTPYPEYDYLPNPDR